MALSIEDLQFAVCEPGARSLWTYTKTREEAEAKALDLMNERGRVYVAEPFEDFRKRVTQAWLDDTPLQEISAEQFEEMLCVLPPIYRKGALGFFMCEFTAGSVTNQYVQHDGRFYVAAVDMVDRSTWITPEKIAALHSTPCELRGCDFEPTGAGAPDAREYRCASCGAIEERDRS